MELTHSLKHFFFCCCCWFVFVGIKCHYTGPWCAILSMVKLSKIPETYSAAVRLFLDSYKHVHMCGSQNDLCCMQFKGHIPPCCQSVNSENFILFTLHLMNNRSIQQENLEISVFIKVICHM